MKTEITEYFKDICFKDNLKVKSESLSVHYKYVSSNEENKSEMTRKGNKIFKTSQILQA